jgi:hypothetical protein
MRSMFTGLVAALILAVPGAAVAPASPVAHAACSSHYTSATIGGSHKCLHAGEYCSRSLARQYTRYGYECSTAYSPPRLRRR